MKNVKNNEDKRYPNTERNAEFTALIEAHTGRKLFSEEFFAEREAAVARLRKLNVI